MTKEFITDSIWTAEKVKNRIKIEEKNIGTVYDDYTFLCELKAILPYATLIEELKIKLN